MVKLIFGILLFLAVGFSDISPSYATDLRSLAIVIGNIQLLILSILLIAFGADNVINFKMDSL